MWDGFQEVCVHGGVRSQSLLIEGRCVCIPDSGRHTPVWSSCISCSRLKPLHQAHAGLPHCCYKRQPATLDTVNMCTGQELDFILHKKNFWLPASSLVYSFFWPTSIHLYVCMYVFIHSFFGLPVTNMHGKKALKNCHWDKIYFLILIIQNAN